MKNLRESIHGYPTGEARGVGSGVRGGRVGGSINRARTHAHARTQDTHTHTVEGKCLHDAVM